jgi:hypothetical protein
MAGSDQNASSEKLIDAAIGACSGNIRRHSVSAALELGVILLLLALLLSSLYTFARLQGEENDARRVTLRSNLKDTLSSLDETRSYERRYEGQLANAQEKMPKNSNSPEFKAATGEVERYKADLQRTRNMTKSAEERVDKANSELRSHRSPPLLSDFLLYGAGATLIVLLGIFTGLYRLHFREITKNEQLKIGLMRIRIAANNAGVQGFDGEVRTSLTSGAFDVANEDRRHPKKIESPLPGHPSSDLAASLLNRFLDEMDVVLQPKAKPSGR